MSANLLDRDTYLDLLAWFQYGRLGFRTWGDGGPGNYLLDRMKYTDADIMPDGMIGYYAEASTEATTLQRPVGRRSGLDVREAGGRAVVHALYTSNLHAVCSRYATQPADGWADLVAGLSQCDPFAVMAWEPADAIGILQCWDYQCAEDVPQAEKLKHAALRYAVQGFRLELAESALKEKKTPRNVPEGGGWAKRMDPTTFAKATP